jgi:hypothetical protein
LQNISLRMRSNRESGCGDPCCGECANAFHILIEDLSVSEVL